MLSPGNGGEHYGRSSYAGGGGGGVLVDNIGPSCDTSQGEGYGGGGGYYYDQGSSNSYGLQGMVLIETSLSSDNFLDKH